MIFVNVFALIIALVLSYAGSPVVLKVLIKGNALSPNYKGEKIPVCMGLMFIIVQVITSLVLIISFKDDIEILYYLIAVLFIGLIGLLDDLIGEKNIKGLKGHIVSFVKGDFTTGGIKAGIGFLISLFVSILISDGILDTAVNTFVIALFTNYSNIFDLRPGRSIKAFIFASIALLITSNTNNYEYIIYSFYGILLVYFPLDLKAKAMMGDVGSNVLGVTLGIYCALSESLTVKAIYLIILLIIHIIAERYSFSKIIDNNRILKFIDNLGR